MMTFPNMPGRIGKFHWCYGVHPVVRHIRETSFTCIRGYLSGPAGCLTNTEVDLLRLYPLLRLRQVTYLPTYRQMSSQSPTEISYWNRIYSMPVYGRQFR